MPPNAGFANYHFRQLRQTAYQLSSASARETVRDAIVEVCRFRFWFLYALHVRTTHVHGIVEADCAPSRIFNAWKAYATRRLRATGEEPSDRICWTHGGSARRVLTRENLTRAMDYVLRGQGQTMATFCAVPGSTPALTHGADRSEHG